MCIVVGIQLSRGESWDPGIQLSRGESWDPVIKRGELGSSYQEGIVEIQLSRGESWDPGIQLSRGESWDPINQFNPAPFLCLSQAMIWISNIICCGIFFCVQ
jgi:hypothetical protein